MRSNGDELAHKGTELRDRIAEVTLIIEAAERVPASKRIWPRGFLNSRKPWRRWGLRTISRRSGQILEIVALNLTLDGVSLVYEMRNPLRRARQTAFRPVKSGRQDTNRTFFSFFRGLDDFGTAVA